MGQYRDYEILRKAVENCYNRPMTEVTNIEKIAGPQVAAAAKLFLEKLALSYDVDYAVAYGSRARGDNRPDSDLDLAVVLNGAHGDTLDVKLNMAGLAYDVLLETEILIQPLPLWHDDLSSPSSFSNPALLKNITSEGIRL